MKRLTARLFFLVAIVCMHPVSAGPLADSFSFLATDEGYLQFMQSIRHDGDVQTAKEQRDMLLTDIDDSLDHLVTAIRCDTALARLCTDCKPKLKDMAKQLLDDAQSYLDRLPDKAALYRYSLQAEIDSIWFLVDSKNLGKGIASKKNIDKAYKAYPQEVTPCLQKANLLLFTPGFYGGDIDEALDLYRRIQDDGNDILSFWDRASLYSGIGIASYKKKDWKNAENYLLEAKKLAPFDPVVDEYLAKLGNTP